MSYQYIRTAEGEPVESRDELLTLMRRGGWIAPFFPPSILGTLAAYELSPSYTNALALESKVNSEMVEPVIVAVDPHGVPAGQAYRDLSLPPEAREPELRLSKEEAMAVLQVLDALFPFGSAGNVFMWDDRDTLEDPKASAFFKLFKLAVRPVPRKLELEASA